MLRKALSLGMVFIFTLSLLAVSMITCFSYDAEAHAIDLFAVLDLRPGHGHLRCTDGFITFTGLHAPPPLPGFTCTWYTQ